MLHMIILILKIIGIIVLVVLGLLLGILLLVLLVPVRYLVDGSYYGCPKGKLTVSWLLHIVSVTAAYDEEFTLTPRIFGFRLRKLPGAESDDEMEDVMVHAMETTVEDAGDAVVDTIQDLPEEPSEVTPENVSENVWEKISENIQEKTPGIMSEEKTEGSSESGSESGRISGQGRKPASDQASRSGLISRIRRIFTGISSKFKFLFQRICDTLKNIKDKKAQIEAIVRDPANQKTVKIIWKQLKKVLRHILPRKGKASITFGFDDPYTTGQVLTYVSMIYPICSKHLEFYPVFDESVLEGEGSFRGRVRLGSLLVCGIRVLLDKNFRTVLKKVLR